MRGIQSPWFAVSLFLIGTTIIASSFSVYYYVMYNGAIEQYQQALSSLRSSTYKVDIMIKFANGTQIWRNSTIIPIGWSLFNATMRATNGDMNYTFYSFAPTTPYVITIFGVRAQGVHSWFWWAWNATERDWQLGEVGANAYILKDGDVVAWYLADTSTWPPTKP